MYLREVVAVRLKPASAKSYRYTIEKHILPALGRKPALSVDHATVSAFHHSLSKTPSAANRAVEMLFRIYRAAGERELIPEGSNPCRQIAPAHLRYPAQPRLAADRLVAQHQAEPSGEVPAALESLHRRR